MDDTQETAIANTEMAAVWDGDEGDEWTENAARYDATDRWIAARFHELAAIGASDRVLDVGCGTGASTRTAAGRAKDGSVLGIDLSSKMLAYARRESDAEGQTNVEFLRGDAQVHPFDPGTFDVVISSFGAMFFADPVAAFDNIRRGLRHGGRIAMVAWQGFDANEWLRTIAAAITGAEGQVQPPNGEPGPFGLAEPESVQHILERAGLVDTELSPMHEPFCLGADVEDAWEFVSSMGLVQGLLEQLESAARDQALVRLREIVDTHVTPRGVLLDSASWMITAFAP